MLLKASLRNSLEIWPRTLAPPVNACTLEELKLMKTGNYSAKTRSLGGRMFDSLCSRMFVSNSRPIKEMREDPFLRKLQEKTEAELEDLSSLRDKGKEGHAKSEIGDVNQSVEDKQDVAARDDEVGGPRGLEPTRYGDWERGGRCSDF